MKALNLKKVAAVGAGLALVAGSVAAAVNWTDLADTTAKSMKVNGIVVGATADASDSEAAALLASALATKASYTVKETQTHDKEVCVDNKDSTLSADAEGYRIHSTMNAENTNDITSSTVLNDTKLESLIGSQNNGAKSQRINGSTYSVTLSEKLVLTADAYYEDDKAVQELATEINNDGLEYKVTYSGSDLNFGVSSSTWTDGSDDYVLLPFLGDWYVVDQVVDNVDELQLVKSSAPQSYVIGDKISGLKGRDGKTYNVLLDSAYTSGSSNYVTLSVVDATTGQTVGDAVEDFTDSQTVTFYVDGSELLEDTLYVDSVQKRTEASSDVFTARIRTGSGRVVLKDGYCYPDYTENDTDKCDWVADVNVASAGVLYNYGIKNTNEYEFTGKTGALAPGEMAYFPNNFAAFKFVGLQLPQYDSPRAKEVQSVKIGAEMTNASGNASETGIVFTSGDVEHQVPFYYHLGEFSLDSVGEKEGVNFEFDGVDHYIVFENDATNTLESTAVLDGTYNSSETYTTDATYITLDNVDATAIAVKGQDDYEVSYRLAIDNDSNNFNVWMVLSNAETFASIDPTAASIDLSFRGTDNDEVDDLNTTTVDETYYLPKDSDFKGIDSWTEALLEDDDSYFTAVFDVNAGGVTTRVNIDTETGLLTLEDDTENSIDWAANVGSIDNDTNFNFTAGTALYTESGKNKRNLTLTGYDFKIVDDSYFEAVIPEEAAEVEFYLYGKEELVAGTQTCETKSVTEDVDVAKTFLGAPLSTIKPEEAVAGKNYIVVGGYMVNSMFPAQESIPTLFEGQTLEAVSDRVIGMNNGNLYVAGYTKEDTVDAVKALIAELEKA